MLSFFSIFGIHNNQNFLDEYNILLWIAFIFQYLWDTQQQLYLKYRFLAGCELLSFFSIFGIHNNNSEEYMKFQVVVNCFHFSVSLGYTTTNSIDGFCCGVLWIAFIFQYLWDTQQRLWFCFSLIFSCELLSFFSIFGIHNNDLVSFPPIPIVVNCFHFSVSLGYTTTYLSKFSFTF